MVSRGSVAGARLLALAASALLLFIGNAIVAPQSAVAQAPGPDVCAGCHEGYVKSFMASIHGKTGDPKSPANNGACSVCHGDGTEHVKAGGGRGVGGIINPGPSNKKMSAEAKSAICLSCHETTRQLAFWSAGKHKMNDVTCSNCHDPHSSTARENSKMLRTPGPAISVYTTTVRQLEYQTCVVCHKDKLAQINKPSHHPIIEGKVKCSDCHNPHGTMNLAMIKGEGPNDTCYMCHTDKRGPWIHEHPPVEENCLNCHSPHGSNHNRMLTMKVPELCQECHRRSGASSGGHRETIVDGRSLVNPGVNPSVTARFMATGCVNCHRQIHGSNAGRSGNGEAFVR
jgi:DmsE family decaheme c-type cytochrome